MFSEYLYDTRTNTMSALLEAKALALSQEQRIEIAEYFLDRKILCKDVVIRKTELAEFAEQLYLDDYRLEHSWAGDKVYATKGEWLIGKGKFGRKYFRQYSLNGDCSFPSEQTLDPDFDTTVMQVVHLEKYHLNTFRNPSVEWTAHYLVIYLPETSKIGG